MARENDSETNPLHSWASDVITGRKMEAATCKNMRLVLSSETGNVAYDMFHMGVRTEMVVHVVPDTPLPPLPTVTCCYNLEKQLMCFYYSPVAEMCWKYLSIPMVPAVLLPQIQCLSKSKETIANICPILPSLLLTPLWEELAGFQSWSNPTVSFLGTVSEKLGEVSIHLQVWSNTLGQAFS